MKFKYLFLVLLLTGCDKGLVEVIGAKHRYFIPAVEAPCYISKLSGNHFSNADDCAVSVNYQIVTSFYRVNMQSLSVYFGKPFSANFVRQSSSEIMGDLLALNPTSENSGMYEFKKESMSHGEATHAYITNFDPFLPLNKYSEEDLHATVTNIPSPMSAHEEGSRIGCDIIFVRDSILIEATNSGAEHCNSEAIMTTVNLIDEELIKWRIP